MVRFSKYIVEPGQSLIDVAILLFGNADGVADLLLANDNLSYGSLYPGQVLYYLPLELNKEVKSIYQKTGYIPATASDMNEAPVPPIAPSPGQVIIHLFNSADLIVTAPNEVTIQPSNILNHLGVTIAQLGPGESYEVERAQVLGTNGFYGMFVLAGDTLTLPLAVVKRSDGVVLASLDPAQEFVVPNSAVTGEMGVYSASVLAGQSLTVPKVVVRNTLAIVLANLDAGQSYVVADVVLVGTLGVYNSTAVVGVTKIIPQVRVYNSAGTLLAQGDPGESVTSPDVNVTRDGLPFASAPAGTTINVTSNCPAPSGILYSRIQPYSQQTSYRVGDVAWHTNNGTFDYVNPTNPAVIQCLDRPNADNFWRLKFNNAFGNKFRFTNSIGNPAATGKLGFVASDFTGSLSWYVIDHLTGIAYYTANLGNFNSNWAGAIDAVHARRSSAFYGFSDWFPMNIAHYLSIVEDNPSGPDLTGMFNGSVVSGFTNQFSWLSDTEGSATGNTYITWSGKRISSQSKTAGSPISIYMCRNHY